jgi:hypothetical protein
MNNDEWIYQRTVGMNKKKKKLPKRNHSIQVFVVNFIIIAAMAFVIILNL